MLKIGISACFFHPDSTRAVFKGKSLIYLEKSMSDWVQAQGAVPYMIPPLAPQGKIGLSDLVGGMDGLILSGGADLFPGTYGEEPLRVEWSGDRIRDAYEIALVGEFQKQEKPILGICRGAQLLNVAFGGSLYQDLSTQLGTSLNHRDWEIYDQNFHEVEISSNGLLARLYPRLSRVRVNSVHHQAVKRLGSGLEVEAVSVTDGVIEAFRAVNWPYIVGVQWHPEFTDPEESGSETLLDRRPLLESFLQAVQKRKG